MTIRQDIKDWYNNEGGKEKLLSGSRRTAGTAGYTVTGALMGGSIGGPIGAGIGATAGFLMGLYKSWENLHGDDKIDAPLIEPRLKDDKELANGGVSAACGSMGGGAIGTAIWPGPGTAIGAAVGGILAEKAGKESEKAAALTSIISVAAPVIGAGLVDQPNNLDKPWQKDNAVYENNFIDWSKEKGSQAFGDDDGDGKINLLDRTDDRDEETPPVLPTHDVLVDIGEKVALEPEQWDALQSAGYVTIGSENIGSTFANVNADHSLDLVGVLKNGTHFKETIEPSGEKNTYNALEAIFPAEMVVDGKYKATGAIMVQPFAQDQVIDNADLAKRLAEDINKNGAEITEITDIESVEITSYIRPHTDVKQADAEMKVTFNKKNGETQSKVLTKEQIYAVGDVLNDGVADNDYQRLLDLTDKGLSKHGDSVGTIDDLLKIEELRAVTELDTPTYQKLNTWVQANDNLKQYVNASVEMILDGIGSYIAEIDDGITSETVTTAELDAMKTSVRWYAQFANMSAPEHLNFTEVNDTINVAASVSDIQDVVSTIEDAIETQIAWEKDGFYRGRTNALDTFRESLWTDFGADSEYNYLADIGITERAQLNALNETPLYENASKFMQKKTEFLQAKSFVDHAAEYLTHLNKTEIFNKYNESMDNVLDLMNKDALADFISERYVEDNSTKYQRDLLDDKTALELQQIVIDEEAALYEQAYGDGFEALKLKTRLAGYNATVMKSMNETDRNKALADFKLAEQLAVNWNRPYWEIDISNDTLFETIYADENINQSVREYIRAQKNAGYKTMTAIDTNGVGANGAYAVTLRSDGLAKDNGIAFDQGSIDALMGYEG